MEIEAIKKTISLKINNMRVKILFISIVSCLALQTNAQLFNNTIVNDDSSWATLIYGLGANNIPCCVETQYVYFEGDSTVAEVSYKKVFSYNDKLHENIKYEGLIREHEKKTYFIPNNSEMEYLLYDFSFDAGTNFEYWDFRVKESMSLYVKNVDFIEINGSLRKRIQFTITPDYEWVVDTWIEGIGSLSGILYPMYRLFTSGGVKVLLCYFQNNELIYKDPNYSECYYDRAEDITSLQIIENDNCCVFPNPVDDLLNISCLDNTISRIEIFDNLGQKVYSQTYKDIINVSSFSKGLYLLKLYDKNEQVTIFKIIKK